MLKDMGEGPGSLSSLHLSRTERGMAHFTRSEPVTELG